MKIKIFAPNGRTTKYGRELLTDARRLTKGKGKLTTHEVHFFQASGQVQLIAYYRDNVSGLLCASSEVI